MKRRGFIKGGVGTIATSASIGFSPGKLIAPSWLKVTPKEMDNFLVGLDKTMNQIADFTKSGQFINALLNKPSSHNDSDSILFRKTMRTLLLVGNFGDLSTQAQVHPGIQKRLKYSENEINSTVYEIKKLLKSLTKKDHNQIKNILNNDSNIGDLVLEAIDLETLNIYVPPRRRVQLRTMGKRIIKRLKHSPEMFINEYLEKAEKIENFPNSEEEARKILAKQVGEQNFNDRVKEAEIEANNWHNLDVGEVPIGYKAFYSVQDGDEKDPRFRVGKRVLG
ncbi:MAG: hypothetical protein OEW75_19165, partial [Cyclobacteriaceae bacterium]|nr:hypothetical protein [Cyclobacteriaceae bacterium]